MSEQDEKASYIDILEEELRNAEEEIATLRMQEEHDWIDQRHELALAFDELRTLKRNELADRLIAEMFAEDEKVERDHELANFMDYAERQNKYLTEAILIINRYLDHFDKHPNNYMSEELKKITRDAKGVGDQ